MPRSRSSGALSIWSYARNFAKFFFASTLVIAAVSVVLPWSTCPIVPMFRCGLFRTNFSLAMSVVLSLASRLVEPFYFSVSAPHALDDRFGHVRRDRCIPRKLHRVCSASLGHRPNIRRITEHARERHLGRDRLRRPARLHPRHAAAPRRQVPGHLAHELIGRQHLDLHQRLEQDRPRLAGRRLGA